MTRHLKARHGRAVNIDSQNHGLRTKQPETCHGENAPDPDIDDLAGDSLAEAFEACDGDLELLEPCEQ